MKVSSFLESLHWPVEAQELGGGVSLTFVQAVYAYSPTYLTPNLSVSCSKRTRRWYKANLQVLGKCLAGSRTVAGRVVLCRVGLALITVAFGMWDGRSVGTGSPLVPGRLLALISWTRFCRFLGTL